MLHSWSRNPGSAFNSRGVKCSASAEEMFSKSPTARSMRITGRLDQKLIPRVACNVVMRISIAGSALSDALIVDSGRARMGANRGERRRHLLGDHDEQHVVA